MADHPQTSLFTAQAKSEKSGPVECLGMTFENDEKRREYFLEKLRDKLKDPVFRQIEGFPIGADEDILGLSDPPYYTACPNPFLPELVKQVHPSPQSNDTIQTVAFADDVEGSKHSSIYNVHTYHTKVPPEAILPLLSHYTRSGDIILDPFSGTGMTAIAAGMCNAENKNAQRRKVILVELSPIGTFIAGNYSTQSIDRKSLAKLLHSTLEELSEACRRFYQTTHTGWPAKIRDEQTTQLSRANQSHRFGEIVYTVWSDVYICPECATEFCYWDIAVDLFRCEVRDVFPCPTCDASLCKEPKYVKKHSAVLVERASEQWFDPSLGKIVTRQRRSPVLISYELDGARYEKIPDQYDLDIIDESDKLVADIHPELMMFRGKNWGDTWRAGVHLGITHAHHFYSNRNLFTLSRFRTTTGMDRRLWLVLTSSALRLSKMNRYMPQHRDNRNGEVVGPLSGTLYIPSIGIEVNPIHYFRSKAKAIENLWVWSNLADTLVSSQSSTDLRQLPDNSVDYIFMDPPFGDNLFYSELNFIWEWWLGLYTPSKKEAIVSPASQKDVRGYTSLMTESLRECIRVLKPGRWLTMEFHNSKNAIWSAINESIQTAGFIVADVRVMDKKKGTTKQLTFANSVKQDLIISAYKPDGSMEDRFKLKAGTKTGVWDFVHTHLKQLPVFVGKGGQAEVIAERQNYLLFDRMVAFHVQRGATVPVSAAEFYQGLAQRFPERNGMYFLPEQAAEYDKKRLTVKEILQLEFFVIDEISAIHWLKQQLTKKPQTFQEIHPQFLREIGGWQKHEKPLELSELLEQNFLRYDGMNDVPSQIHSHLSTNFKELRNLPKDSPTLRVKAKDRWYVPDPNKAGDLEKLRERALLREFLEYLPPGYTHAQPDSQEGFIPGLESKATPIPKGKKFKVIRMEAVRAGFKHCWQNRDYRTIIAVARRIPENVLQEDQKLLMWYDQALTRSGEE